MLFWLRIVIHILKVMLAELEYDSVYKQCDAIFVLFFVAMHWEYTCACVLSKRVWDISEFLMSQRSDWVTV